MKKNQKALIRHNIIYQRLQQGETVNVKVLSEEFGVSVRTMQKDMNERLSSTYDIVDLGQDSHRCCGGMDASLRFCFGYTLDAMHARFEFQS